MKELSKSLFDLHLHTQRSPDASSSHEQIIETAKKKGLAGFIKSDHDSNRKSDYERLKDLAVQQELIVIPGAEVTCLPPSIDTFLSVSDIKPVRFKLEVPHIVRHLIVAGVPPEKHIPIFRRTPQMIAQWAHDEGGVVIAAHPKENGGASSLSKREIFNLASHLDGLEVANPLGSHHEVVLWAKELNLATVGGSDSHSPATVGIAGTELPGMVASWQDAVSLIRERKASAYLAPNFHEHTHTKSTREKLWQWTTQNVL